MYVLQVLQGLIPQTCQMIRKEFNSWVFMKKVANGPDLIFKLKSTPTFATTTYYEDYLLSTWLSKAFLNSIRKLTTSPVSILLQPYLPSYSISKYYSSSSSYKSSASRKKKASIQRGAKWKCSAATEFFSQKVDHPRNDVNLFFGLEIKHLLPHF